MRAIATLEPESYVSLETFRRSGVGVKTPVWFSVLDDKLYVVTDGTSGKVKRIRATKRGRVAACGVTGTVHGEWFDAAVRIVKDRQLIDRAHAALKEKYGWQMWLLDAGSTLFGRIGRRAWIEVSV